MKKKKRKLNKQKVIVLVAILLIFITIVINNINKKNNRYKDLTILMNNEFIELINPVVIQDNNVFFSKDDIKNIFDDTIYYNEVEKELITTYNKHVALLKVDEEYAEINGETIKLEGKLQEIEGKIYLPITDLKIVYDLDIEYSEKSNRVIIDLTQEEKIEATVIKKSNIKSKKGLLGSEIDTVIIGDKVTVLEKIGKYKKVRTSLGNIGYIKSKNLSDDIVIREEQIEEKKQLQVYRNYSNISGIYDNIQVDDKKLNVVVPTFFYMDKNSKVLDKSNTTTAAYSIYKNWTTTNKLEILPTFTNNDSVSNNLLSYSQRSSVIKSLKNYLLKYNYIGVNIEFNSIDDVNSFYRFIIELVPIFKESGLKVAVTLNDNIDKNRIEGIVDYIIEK